MNFKYEPKDKHASKKWKNGNSKAAMCMSITINIYCERLIEKN